MWMFLKQNEEFIILNDSVLDRGLYTNFENRYHSKMQLKYKEKIE